MPRLTFEYKITVANLIQIAILVVGGFWMYATLVNSVSRATDQLGQISPRVNTLESVAATFNTRLTVVESRAETQAVAMEKMSDVLERMGSTVNGLSITAATTKTDVGYIRDYIESVKRSAQP